MRTHLQLSPNTLTTFPMAYALITKMVTLKLPNDPKLQQE